MLPNFLVPETDIREDGVSQECELGSSSGKMLLVTLGITRIIEQESLDISIWGSADGQDWGAKPVVSFPQKFYCGTYQLLLDLSSRSDVKYVRVQWKMGRWGRGSEKPLFGFYVFSEELADQSLAARTA
ncbi:MAG: hypothetical protein ABFD89_13540 [Bryobacteraceae bacterium]